MTQEGKAKRYDDLLVKLQKAKEDNNVCDERYCCVIDNIVPELRESEDEKIRKWIIGVLSTYEHDRDLRNAALAWLEKQGEHDVYKESFNDGYKLGYREASENIQEEPEKYGLCKIEKLGEQNPAFSEEDEYVFNKVLNWVLIVNPTSSIFEKLPKEQFIERFKSIRPQSTWKPSDEQIKALEDSIEFLGCTKKVKEDLKSLYEQLKKLRENKL